MDEHQAQDDRGASDSTGLTPTAGSGGRRDVPPRVRRWAAIGAGGVVVGLLAIAVVGALDDAPHGGDADGVPSAADDTTEVVERTITVVGQGSATAPPDAARISLGVEVSETEANAAIDGANASAQLVLDLVTSSGIDATDVQTTDVSVYPRYGNDGRDIIGYTASNRLVVTVRDLDALGGLLDAAAGLVGDDIRIDGLGFILDDPTQADSEARADAVEDARTRADEYAAAAGVELGDVMAISETGSYESPVPAFAADGAAEASGVPIAAGEQTRTASVTIVYAIG